MKTKIIFGLLTCLMFGGCAKDDDVIPSYKDQDWFRIEDDPNDALTHLRYTIYMEEGVPIFYNDTLGSEIRYNKAGEAYTYYEILKLGYAITGASSALKYALADDLTDVMAMTELMDKYLFDYLPKGKRPLSYLLVDSAILKTGSQGGYTVYDDYYKAMTSTCVGNIEKVKEMTENEKKSFAAELAGLEFVDDVVSAAELTGDLVAAYDSLSLKVKLDLTTYAPIQVGNSGYGAVISGNRSRQLPESELFGLIHYRHAEGYSLFIPTKEQDKAAYIGMILSLTDEEIREKYKDYPVVLEKYGLIRKMLVRVGIIEDEPDNRE